MCTDSSLASLLLDTQNAKFADLRLRARLLTLTSRLAANPSQSFPKVFTTSAELEGNYRFFGNPLVTPDQILSGHFDSTRRSASAELTLVVHDTSTFAFDPDGERKGLGRVRDKGQAFFAHVSLALAADGSRRPLGLSALKTWVRGDERSGTEKLRWWESVQLSAERLDGTHNLIHVMDREADDYALFARLAESHHRFIIRSAHDRLLVGSTRRDPQKISHATAQIECAVHRQARLSKRVDGERSPKQKGIHPSRGTRVAKLSIGATPLTLKRPTSQDDRFAESLSLHAVHVWEPDPPVNEVPIEWTLLTTEPIDSVDALLRIVDHYRARWTIEEYFKAIKTGCAFLERQLGDYEGLVNALAVFAPIACRLLFLRTRARNEPDEPATQVLEPDEIDVLRTLGRQPLPPSPTVREALLALAALGGHIKWSGEPGWLTISRGFTELETLTRGWRAAKIRHACDQG